MSLKYSSHHAAAIPMLPQLITQARTSRLVCFSQNGMVHCVMYLNLAFVADLLEAVSAYTSAHEPLCQHIGFYSLLLVSQTLHMPFVAKTLT